MRNLRIVGGCFAGLVFAAAASHMSAATYSFVGITPNNVLNNLAAQSQLSVDVNAVANPNQVAFVFHNSGALPMSITDIYFDDGTLLGIASITSSSGVAFSQGASPPNLPGGNAVNFNTTAGFLADSDSPVAANGVDHAGESVTILFNLISGQTFANVIAAINTSLASPGVDVLGGLRIGIHVQAFGDGSSAAFVNGGGGGNSPVPDGGTTVLLLGSVLGALGMFRRKFGSA